MKTMKFYLMMLMAAVMTFGLTACGGDSNDSGGNGSAPDYVGIWLIQDSQTNFIYTECKADSWTNVEYHLSSSTGKVSKEVYSGGLSVNGNQIALTGPAPFSTGTYSISGNTMTITFTHNGNTETERMTRISSADAAAKVAAWEALYLAWQQNNR